MYGNRKEIMKKISILHWTTSPFNMRSMGGIEVIEYNLFKRLRKEFKVKLYVPRLIGKEKGIIELNHNKFLMKYDINYYKQFIDMNGDSDYFLGNNTPFLALFNPEKTTVIFHNFINFLGKDSFLPFYLFFKKKYKRAKFAFCSDFLKKEFIKQYPDFPKDRLFTIYNAVDKNIINTKRGKFNKIKKIVFIGQWNYNKGYDLLINGIKRLRNKRNDFELFLIGGPNLWNNKKSNIDLSFLNEEYIKKVGILKNREVLNFITGKDILIAPSRWKEPFGIVAIEGLSKGLIVLTSGRGGLGNIIQNNKNGFIFKNGNSKDLSKRLDFIMSMETKDINRIRKEGYNSIKTNFNWDNYINKLKKTLVIE